MAMPTTEPNELSDRELDILKLVATGAGNKEIAQKLFISSNTVKVHLRNIFTKIGVASRTEAAMYAVRAGMVEAAFGHIIPTDEGEGRQEPIPAANGESATGLTVATSKAEKKHLSLWYLIPSLAAVILIAYLGFRFIPGVNVPPTSTPIPQTPTPRVQWFSLAALPVARKGLAVAVYENRIYAIAGETADEISGIVERYDPQTNTWQELSSKPTAVSEVNAGVLGGLIYVPGGRLSSGAPTSLMEQYDPKTDTWSTDTSLPIALCAYSLAVFEGKMYIFGGWDGEKITSQAFVFDPGKDTWTSIESMPTARETAGAVVVGRKIYVIGGWDGQQSLTTNEVYLTDFSGPGSAWTKAAQLPSGRRGMGLTNIADIIFVIGGVNPGDDLTAIAISQDETEWRKLESPLPQGWTDLSVVTVGTRLYAMGGMIDSALVRQVWGYQVIFTITLPIIR